MDTPQPTFDWEPWKLPYLHGTLAVYPPLQIREYINRFRKELDPVSHSYAEAHITLTQPLMERVTDQVADRLETALRSEKPFKVTFGPLRSFLPSPVLWLEVQPAQRVLHLRRKLHTFGIFDLSLPHTEDFVPHMTITEGLSGPRVDEDLFRKTRLQVEGGRFECTRLVHLVPDGEFRFLVEREYLLNDA